MKSGFKQLHERGTFTTEGDRKIDRHPRNSSDQLATSVCPTL